MEILTGPERCRRRPAREKFAIVRASLEPGAVIADVARRFGVTRQQVYRWRSDFRPFAGADPPAVACFFTPDRKGDHPQQHLAQFAGILQADVSDVLRPFVCQLDADLNAQGRSSSSRLYGWLAAMASRVPRR